MAKRPSKGKAPVSGTTGASSEANPYHKESNMSDSKAVQVSSQPVFNFGAHSVRVVVRDGEPWFVASDVAKALEFRDASNAARMLSEHQKGTHSVSTVQGNQQLTVVSEGGLYRMVLRSRKPSAVAFSDWVTDEVLPAIRKTGVYVGKPFTVNPGDVLTAEEQNTLRLMLKSAVERLPKERQGGAMVKGWSKLKAHFGVPYREIPRQEFSEAVSIIARHTAEWELVDDAPRDKTVPEIVAEWVKKIEEPNGYPAFLFQPLVEAVQRKLGKRSVEIRTDQMIVDRRKLAAIWIDLGKIRNRVDGLGTLESDLPPSWWKANEIGGEVAV